MNDDVTLRADLGEISFITGTYRGDGPGIARMTLVEWPEGHDPNSKDFDERVFPRRRVHVLFGSGAAVIDWLQQALEVAIISERNGR